MTTPKLGHPPATDERSTLSTTDVHIPGLVAHDAISCIRKGRLDEAKKHYGRACACDESLAQQTFRGLFGQSAVRAAAAGELEVFCYFWQISLELWKADALQGTLLEPLAEAAREAYDRCDRAVFQALRDCFLAVRLPGRSSTAMSFLFWEMTGVKAKRAKKLREPALAAELIGAPA